MKQVQEISLGDCTWQWKQADAGEDEWKPCSRFPTNIHHELRVLKLIPDEGVELNERKIQWVGEKDWVFRREFPSPPDFREYDHVVLAFDGLDTIAKVTLNGEVVLECENMFTPHRVEVRKHLAIGKLGGDNELEIYFTSAAKVARERLESSGFYWKNIREESRVWVRKAQYHWGWDWGPSMITCGLWKDARLEMYQTRIQDVFADVQLDEQCKSAEVDLVVEMESAADGLTLHGAIKHDATSRQSETTNLAQNQNVARLKFQLDKPELWWPVRHGAQPLYEAVVELKAGNAVLQTRHIKFGIRKVELVRRSLKSGPGETFFFRMNNRPIFCCGTNWIPCHSLPALATPELYEQNLKYVVENNNNMIRIWGGGIYEHDAFYEYCDEKGLMVWHDMMFACGIYPEEEWFHKSVTDELEAQVSRLRNHPSITLWNGDNEVFFMYDRYVLLVSILNAATMRSTCCLSRAL